MSAEAGLQFKDMIDNQVTETWSWDKIGFIYLKNNHKIKFEKKLGLERKIKLEDGSQEEETRFVDALQRCVRADQQNLIIPGVKTVFNIIA